MQRFIMLREVDGTLRPGVVCIRDDEDNRRLITVPGCATMKKLDEGESLVSVECRVVAQIAPPIA